MKRIKVLKGILNNVNNIKAQLKGVNQYLDSGGDPGTIRLQYATLIERIDQII